MKKLASIAMAAGLLLAAASSHAAVDAAKAK